MSLEFVQGAAGHEVTTMPDAELKKFSDGCLEVLLGEAAKIDAQGLPGTAVVTKIRELIEKYN
jgi:hypothetical protein